MGGFTRPIPTAIGATSRLGPPVVLKSEDHRGEIGPKGAKNPHLVAN